jgi:hypothetical protein
MVALVVTFATIAYVLAACTGSSGTSRATPRGTPTKTITTLGMLVNLKGPIEITYDWTGDRPGAAGPGMEVWRSSGTLTRWDSLLSTDSPTFGGFVVFDTAAEDGRTFGCRWTASKAGDSILNTGCDSDSGAGSLADLYLGQGFALLADSGASPNGSESVLGKTLPCYRTRITEQVCADEQGRVLYFSYRSGNSLITLKATSMTSNVEPFDWPTGALATPTGARSVARPVADLQLPASFHLGEKR